MNPVQNNAKVIIKKRKSKMPVVEESRSESSLYDFFDEAKNRKRGNASKEKKTDTTEEKASITDTEKKSKDDDNSKKESNVNEGELITEIITATQLSESDSVLIENVSEQEKSAIRSKTSDETTENASTERYVKSDTAFASELVSEYPDIEGAGDGSYSIISNDDEGVQIDIHIDTGMSEFSDRATAVTNDSQANNYVNDAISDNENEATLSDIAEDRGQSIVSDEDGEYVSDNEYEGDKETSIEVEVYCDSDTDQSNDSSATESEDEQVDDNSESDEYGLRDDSSEEERDSASQDDNSERGSVASYCRCDSDKEDENSPVVSDDDSDQGSHDRLVKYLFILFIYFIKEVYTFSWYSHSTKWPSITIYLFPTCSGVNGGMYLIIESKQQLFFSSKFKN